MTNEQILNNISTLDIVSALSKRQGIVCNSVKSKRLKIATLFIIDQEDQDEIIKICSKQYAEIERELIARNE